MKYTFLNNYLLQIGIGTAKRADKDLLFNYFQYLNHRSRFILNTEIIHLIEGQAKKGESTPQNCYVGVYLIY